jgi:hypothetical protein
MSGKNCGLLVDLFSVARMRHRQSRGAPPSVILDKFQQVVAEGGEGLASHRSRV